MLRTRQVMFMEQEYGVEGREKRSGAISSPKKPLSTLRAMEIIFIVCTLILAPWLANIERKILK